MKKKYIAKTAIAPVFVLIAGISLGYAATEDWSGQTGQQGSEKTALEQIADVSGAVEGTVIDKGILHLLLPPPPPRLPPLPPGPLPPNVPLFQSVYEFFYSSDFLNNGSGTSRLAAKTWLDRGFCGDMGVVQRMKIEYRQHYDFAYSSNGLNYGSREAKQYAIDAIRARNITPCGDMLR